MTRNAQEFLAAYFKRYETIVMEHIVKPVVLFGALRSGKSRILKLAQEALEKKGYRVFSLSITGTALTAAASKDNFDDAIVHQVAVQLPPGTPVSWSPNTLYHIITAITADANAVFIFDNLENLPPDRIQELFSMVRRIYQEQQGSYRRAYFILSTSLDTYGQVISAASPLHNIAHEIRVDPLDHSASRQYAQTLLPHAAAQDEALLSALVEQAGGVFDLLEEICTRLKTQAQQNGDIQINVSLLQQVVENYVDAHSGGAESFPALREAIPMIEHDPELLMSIEKLLLTPDSVARNELFITRGSMSFDPLFATGMVRHAAGDDAYIIRNHLYRTVLKRRFFRCSRCSPVDRPGQSQRRQRTAGENF